MLECNHMFGLPDGILSSSALRVGGLTPRSRIHLRRFAGPLTYVGQMSPLRVAHLTDQHVGKVTPFSIQLEAVAKANAESPDLVVLTGDFVCHSQLYLDQLTEVVSLFRVPVLAVLGNHDHWAGANEVKEALRKGGAEVLCNQNTTITLGSQKLQVVGLDDAYTGHARIDEATKGLRNDLPVLGLSHIAEEADALWARHVPFVLSGHTHAGQITVARLHELASGRLFGHRYVHGLYGNRANRPDGQAHGAVYVGAGIGAAIMPIRVGDRGRREVTIFELGVAPGSFEEHHKEQPTLDGRKPSAALVAKRARQVVEKRERRERQEQNGGRIPPKS